MRDVNTFPPSSPGEISAPDTILIVEDDAGLNRLIVKRLKREGFQTLSARSGEEAVAEISGNCDLLMLLDYQLPEMTANDLLDRLDEKDQSVPFIVITGHGDERIAVDLMKRGAIDYIVKDISFIDVLPQKIHRAREHVSQQRKLAATEEALRISEELHRTLIDISPDEVTVTDFDGKITKISQKTLELHGYEKAAEIIGMNALDLIIPTDRPRALENMRKTLQKGFVRGVEYTLMRKDGSTFIGELSASVLTDSVGNPKCFIGITRDITERKQAQDQIRKDLKEKEILLKEIHHRVKNNLQVIVSLLNLQSSAIRSKPALTVLQECKDRIYSMAVIHEMLYRSENFASIDFSRYLQQLGKKLMLSYRIDPTKLNLSLTAENISLGLDVAIPCGIIVNELMTNAFKYAFPNGRKGTLQVDFSAEDNRHNLIVQDDGIGLPERHDITNPKTLGLNLVNMLVEQIEGDVELTRGNGTRFKITFQKTE